MRAPELEDVARRIAALALEDRRQGGRLSLRQREQLRRAFAAAGEFLVWSGTPGDGAKVLAAAEKHVLALAQRGLAALEKDLAQALREKRVEVTQLEETAASARELADDPDADFDTEITYDYTARDATHSLVTKTRSVVVSDADEALSAAESIEKSLPARGKLTDQMIVDLEHQGGELSDLGRSLPDFVRAWRALLKAVIMNLD